MRISAYFYDRKRGEFYDGLTRNYISEDNMVDRSVFLRVAACMHNEASKARRTGDDVLFRTESFHELMTEDLSYRGYMYGYFCHQYLTELEKKYRNLINNRYGAATYGNALRYGRYAVVSVAGRTYREEMEPEDCCRFARYYTKAVLKQWLVFERRISRYSHNKNYFYSEEVDGRIETVLDYDGYYKGKTLDQDLGKISFPAGDIGGGGGGAGIEIASIYVIFSKLCRRLVIIFFKCFGEGIDIRISEIFCNFLNFIIRVQEPVSRITHTALNEILLGR